MPKRKPGDNVTFEFGDTETCRAFFERNPKFFPVFERLLAVSNKCLAQQRQPKNRLEDVGFGLAHTCREDFLEILFLSVNGYSNGALKLLRGLYERAITLEFIIRNPEKADRFVNYAAIQEHRAMQAALKLFPEAVFDQHMRSPLTAAEIKSRYEQFKPDFQITDCKKCKTTRIAPSWDEMDLASMVNKLGDPHKQLYLMAYAIPNLSIHATLASASRYDNVDESPEFCLLVAMWAFTLSLFSQNKLFHLNLDSELDALWKDLEQWYTPEAEQKHAE